MTRQPADDWRVTVYSARSAYAAHRSYPRRADRERILSEQGDSCLYCELPIGTAISRQVDINHRYSRSSVVTLRRNWDHFVPYAYLLRNPTANWALACHVCNAIKAARMFDTIANAREVILRRREEQGYEPVYQVLARIAAGVSPPKPPKKSVVRSEGKVPGSASASAATLAEKQLPILPGRPLSLLDALPWLKQGQVSAVLSVSSEVLKKWRRQGYGPSWELRPEGIRYSNAEVKFWMKSRPNN